MADPVVQAALQQAWADSLPADPGLRHEEGGWVYADAGTGQLIVRRAAAGAQHTIDLTNPPLMAGAFVVATFHTHPNPTAEGWSGGPSIQDEVSANLLGVPCIIRADDGDYRTGPERRRGGLSGNAGFPD